MTPGRAERRPIPTAGEGAVPLRSLDPTIIHRARAVNADVLRLIDEMLDQIADAGRI